MPLGLQAHKAMHDARNKSNTLIYDLMNLLTQYPHTDPDDIAVIQTEFLRQE